MPDEPLTPIELSDAARADTRSETPNRRWPSVVAAFMLHACILLCVLLLPPIVYDAVRTSNYQGIEWLHFSGGATYPLYAIYWLSKLKNFRAKFMLLHLTVVLTIAVATAFASNRHTPMFVAFLPTAAAALPLLAALVSWLHDRRKPAVTYMVGSLLALLIAVPSSLLIIYGIAMSSIGPMRY
ncbi:uncharacterized membrane protein YhaH (DUF805 family) [Variovorax paradoxus]|uniref:hypothetical protein n=1 Tax=Variovorax paradoxus TaxID=34073 RepID=UPI00278B1CE0|nr:hypothetical protein [Variovorax paradoxus]MDQ0023796.1 uncharacterized membrane protein YhaH (DUF805 family) [Variovorax paradoxus]